jgi:hypothetical protein
MSDPTDLHAPSASAAASAAAAPAPHESLPAAQMTTGATASPSQRPAPVGDASRERIESFTRLLIGVAFEASDELWLRLRLWQELARSATLPARPETPADRLRFALVGLVFEA